VSADPPHGEGLLPAQAALADYLDSLLAGGPAAAAQADTAAGWRVFQAAGIALAVPAAEVTGIGDIPTEALRRVGLQVTVTDCPIGGRATRLVRTSRLIRPAGDRGSPRPALAVWLRGGPVALAVERELAPVASFAAESVVWRSAQTERPWLAGVAPRAGIALLDVDGLLGMAGNQDLTCGMESAK
jgi:hypothetical protein